MPIAEAAEFFEPIQAIHRYLQTLVDVGLGYVRLGQSRDDALAAARRSASSSRPSCSAARNGRSIYVLDEPTTGLHFEDVRKLLEVLSSLVDKGNTVIVIEHNLDVIKSADWVIDLGPEGGSGGGEVIATGTPEQVAAVPRQPHRRIPRGGARRGSARAARPAEPDGTITRARQSPTSRSRGRSRPTRASTGSATPTGACSTSARRRTCARGCRTTSRRCTPCTSAPGAWSRPRHPSSGPSSASDVDSLQLEYMWIKEFDPPFNVRYKDDKSYPFMAITLADEAPRVIVTRNRRIPGAKYFGPYPKVWAVHDTIDLMIKVFPIRTCSDSELQEGDGDRPAVLPRSDRPLRRPVLDEGHDRGAPRDRRRLHRVHGRRRPAVHERADAADAGGLRRDGLRGGRASTATGSRRSTPCSSKSALVLARRHGCRPLRHRRGRARRGRAALRRSAAAACAACAPRRSRRSSTSRAATWSTRCCSAPTAMPRPPTSRARCWCPRCPTTPPSSRSGCATRRGGKVHDPGRAARRKAELLKTATLNAQQALMLHKTRRTQRLRRPHAGAHRPAGGARPRRGAAAHRVLRRLAPRAARTSSRRWWSSRTGCRARTSTARSAFPRRPTTPTRSTRCSRGASRTSTGATSGTSRAARQPRDRPSRRRGGCHDAQAPAVRLPAAAARRRRRQAAGRGGGARARGAGHEEIALCGIAKRLEEVWTAGGGLPGDPAAHQRGAVPAAAPARRGAPVRDHPPARGVASATSRACSPRSPGSDRRASRRCCGISARSRSSRAPTPEEIAELPGVGPKLAAAMHAHLTGRRRSGAPIGWGVGTRKGAR